MKKKRNQREEKINIQERINKMYKSRFYIILQ